MTPGDAEHAQRMEEEAIKAFQKEAAAAERDRVIGAKKTDVDPWMAIEAVETLSKSAGHLAHAIAELTGVSAFDYGSAVKAFNAVVETIESLMQPHREGPTS